MSRIFLSILFVSSLFSDSSDYTFRGKHFVASYMECDVKSLVDLEQLVNAMDGAVKASGATILDKTSYVFSPNGLTLVYLLSESHASLHTYPEHGACFVDLFTCGNSCSAEKFDEAMRQYLQPKRVNARLFLRDESIEELCITE